MTQYKETVLKHALMLQAEEWAKGVSEIHCHSLSSMYYDQWPEDTDKGNVTDISYNDGTIIRTKNSQVIRVIGEPLSGQSLLDTWSRTNKEAAEILEAL
jgi:hypothetical protein